MCRANPFAYTLWQMHRETLSCWYHGSLGTHPTIVRGKRKVWQSCVLRVWLTSFDSKTLMLERNILKRTKGCFLQSAYRNLLLKFHLGLCFSSLEISQNYSSTRCKTVCTCMLSYWQSCVSKNCANRTAVYNFTSVSINISSCINLLKRFSLLGNLYIFSSV